MSNMDKIISSMCEDMKKTIRKLEKENARLKETISVIKNVLLGDDIEPVIFRFDEKTEREILKAIDNEK